MRTREELALMTVKEIKKILADDYKHTDLGKTKKADLIELLVSEDLVATLPEDQVIVTVEPTAEPTVEEPKKRGRKAVGLTDEQRTDMAELTDGIKTKSSKIKILFGQGYTNTEITRFMGCRYQMVYNITTYFPGLKEDQHLAEEKEATK